MTEEEARDIRAVVKKVPDHHKVRALILYAKSPKCRRAELREVILRQRKSRDNMPDWLLKTAALTPTAVFKMIERRVETGSV